MMDASRSAEINVSLAAAGSPCGLRAGHRLRAATARLRPADRRAPGHRVQAGRDGDQGRGGPPDDGDGGPQKDSGHRDDLEARCLHSPGAHPQVWEHAWRKASKAQPEASIRCGAPSFKKRTVTSAPHGARARLRRCSSMLALALAVSSPGASRTLIFARATGTSLFAAPAVGGASIPRTATAGRPQSRWARVPVPMRETLGRTLANRRISASWTSMSYGGPECNPSIATFPWSSCNDAISRDSAVRASGTGPP